MFCKNLDFVVDREVSLANEFSPCGVGCILQVELEVLLSSLKRLERVFLANTRTLRCLPGVFVVLPDWPFVVSNVFWLFWRFLVIVVDILIKSLNESVVLCLLLPLIPCVL